MAVHSIRSRTTLFSRNEGLQRMGRGGEDGQHVSILHREKKKGGPVAFVTTLGLWLDSGRGGRLDYESPVIFPL